MANDSKTKRKRMKLSEGDVFELTAPDGRWGYGIIVKRGVLRNGGTPYIAVFRSLYDERPALSEIASDEVALAGWTTDALLYHGRWEVIAQDAPLPAIPFPNFKVEVSGNFYRTDVEGKQLTEASPLGRQLLDYEWSRTPIAFQKAFEALHGFGEWQDHYEEAYSSLRTSTADP